MADPRRVPAEVVDPFDLPDWIGSRPVTWSAEEGVGDGHLLHATLSGEGGATACDVLAGDHAFPEAALGSQLRRDMHQAWIYDQVLVLTYGGRMTLAVPGRVVDADMVLAALRRFAKAVGAPPDRFSVSLRL